MMKKLAILPVLLVLSTTAFAQVPSFEPPPEVSKFSWSIGKWTGEGKMAAQGSEMDMKITMTYSMEGQFLKCITISDFGIMKMEEVGYLGYNAEKKQYKMWTFSNMSPDPRIETGAMVGDKLVMTSEPWTIMGQSMIGRGTLEKKDEKTLNFLLEFKEGDKFTVASNVVMKKS